MWDVGRQNFKSREEQLRKLSQVVEQIPVAMVITDKNGNIEYVNDFFTKMTGYFSEEVVGKTPRILKSGTHPDSFYKELWETILSGKTWNGDFVNRKKSGQKYWESATVTPIMNSNSEITHFVSVKQDISERKSMEKELLKAKEFAESAAKVKSNFLANMSHEIRTPMNAIIGFLQLVLEDSVLPDHHWQNLDKAYHAARGLLYLLNDIIDISKLESEKLVLEKIPFHLSKLLKKIMAILEISAKRKGLELRLEIADGIPKTLLGDPIRLKQILMNLLGNAIKFTEKGIINIYIDAESELLHFKIVDTGIGIPTDQIECIFKSFRQLDEKTSRKFGGVGLGTTISKQFVELMGGKIWVESELGEGSTFHFTLPLLPTQKSCKETDIFGESQLLYHPRRQFRILLVDDMEENLFLMALRLEQQGHVVITARDGIEAVEKYQKSKPNVIFMDIYMPLCDGFEATRKIREIEKFQGGHVPIIAMTASMVERRKYRQIGIDDVISKPIDFTLLLRKLGKIFSKKENKNVPKKIFESYHIPSLEGIEVEKAMKIWLNPQVYMEALFYFSERYENMCSEFLRLLKEKNLEKIRFLSHSAKGVTGNLCIPSLHKLSAQIEKAARNKRIEMIEEKVHLFDVAFREVCSSIYKLKKIGGRRMKKEKDLSLGELKILLSRMFSAFKKYNPYVLEPYLTELKQSISDSELETIEEYVKKFDFDSAKEATLRLAKTLGINLER